MESFQALGWACAKTLILGVDFQFVLIVKHNLVMPVSGCDSIVEKHDPLLFLDFCSKTMNILEVNHSFAA